MQFKINHATREPDGTVTVRGQLSASLSVLVSPEGSAMVKPTSAGIDDSSLMVSVADAVGDIARGGHDLAWLENQIVPIEPPVRQVRAREPEPAPEPAVVEPGPLPEAATPEPASTPAAEPAPVVAEAAATPAEIAPEPAPAPAPVVKATKPKAPATPTADVPAA